MASKFCLYLGIVLACSGIGTGLGIVFIILYVWEDIREAIENDNVTDSNVDGNNCNANYYSEDTAEKMR